MAEITDQVRWRRVLNHVAADLKMLASIAAGEKIIVEQATAADLEALVTLKGLRGIIPNPIAAPRIYETGFAEGLAANDFYPVASGVKLFISSAHLSSRESAAAVSGCLLAVKDPEDALIFTILAHNYDLAGHQSSALSFFPAIEVPEDYTVYVQSAHANIDASAYIFGWLEVA